MNSFKINTRFINPEKVLFKAGLISGQTMADLGSGSGHYAIAAAKVVGGNGRVYAADILDSSLNHLVADARVQLIRNIETVKADFEQAKSLDQIPEGSCDVVLLANVFHQIKNTQNLLGQVYRILKTQGKLLVIEWNDSRSPFGPKAELRISESEVNKLISAAGLKYDKHLETDQYHYALTFIK